MNVINRMMSNDPLAKLVQEENFIGWVYNINYTDALVMTNDLWKSNALGVPHNCFLVAASFDPKHFAKVNTVDRQVILLRVVGSAKLPQDDDLVIQKIDHFQNQEQLYDSNSPRDYDDITRSQLQFGGLQCRVLGTFYTNGDGRLLLGSDLESYEMAARLGVYRPRRDALETIVNYIDPIRRQKAEQDAHDLGFKQNVDKFIFKLGTVRYTSTDRMHRGEQSELVPVSIQAFDFLARRTAVLGMTRTGKSNTVKQLVSVVKRVADDSGVPIGQLIYDVNGEYANANQQDKGAIADAFPRETIRYRMVETSGFEDLRNNFYLNLSEGFAIIRQVLLEKNISLSGDVQTFLNTSFDEPDKQEYSTYARWQRRVAAYKALLHIAGFQPPRNEKVFFEANKDVREPVAVEAGRSFEDPKSGLSLDDATEWFLAARAIATTKVKDAESEKKHMRDWLGDDVIAMLNLMAKKNDSGTYIVGYGWLVNARGYHSPRRNQEVSEEIYQHLLDGKIVILDLSVGEATLRQSLSERIARDIFNKSMEKFTSDQFPPNIVVYIEEAHNLIGRELKLTDTWPRLAKEGAKYRIALVYATQEVSSIHPNILANTENWFVSHLNNDREIKELARFYDFEDFSRSLMRAQDIGFARVKTLSSPFVVPVQIDKFDPAAGQIMGSERLNRH